MYLFSCIYAVDSGMGVIGFFKMLAVFFFLCCTLQLTEEERRGLLEIVPFAACFMIGVGILAYIIKPLQNYFFVAERLGGTFQYPNVYAVFCLLGIIILLKSEKRNMIKWLQIVCLLLGIFWSGSRTVFFLLLLVGIILAVKEKEYRIPIVVLLAGIGLLLGIYVYITGNVQNIGRFLTTSIFSSTFLGRILYAKDAIRLLLQHPFGLGYLGYYFMEPKIQTGVYSVRYVHNDFLQIALDVGIFPCVLFMCMLLKHIFGKGKSIYNRLSLLVMALHFLVDFDLEFTAIWFVLILLLDPFEQMEESKKVTVKRSGIGAVVKSLTGITAILGLYIGTAMIPKYVSNPELTVHLLPFNTEAKAELLRNETDMEIAVAYAQELIDQNKYMASAYDVLALQAYQNGNYHEMMKQKDLSLKLQKYDVKAYERYIILLSHVLEREDVLSDKRMEVKIKKKVGYVEKSLQRVEQSTDKLAYMIRDIPNFQLDKEVAEYVRKIKESLKKQ